MGMTAVEKQISPPPAPDYTPLPRNSPEAKPNWVWSWSPWVAQVRTFESMRRLGWNGRYITWAHLNAEEELARIKDGEFYVVGTNAFMEDNLPIHARDPRRRGQGQPQLPVSYLTEGFVAGLVVESVLRTRRGRRRRRRCSLP